MQRLSRVFQTLSDRNRLNIIHSVGERECSVGEIVKSTSLSQPLVSFHLRVLKENGILDTKRHGPFIYYSLKDIKILLAIQLFNEILEDDEKKKKEKINFYTKSIKKNVNKK